MSTDVQKSDVHSADIRNFVAHAHATCALEKHLFLDFAANAQMRDFLPRASSLCQATTPRSCLRGCWPVSHSPCVLKFAALALQPLLRQTECSATTHSLLV